MVELACPECHTRLDQQLNDCCIVYRGRMGAAIPDLTPRGFLNDPAYLFEGLRYEAIAEAGPGNYAGYAESKPKSRAFIMRGLLEEAGISEFVNIGPGFGALEDATAESDRMAIDPCKAFLLRIKWRCPGVRCVRGIAEQLPLATGSVPCLVADSVFQSIIDRERFLYEIGRVCAPEGARLFLTIGYAWNYPRRPQNGFNVNRPDEQEILYRFLEELGFDIEPRYLDLARGWVDCQDEGQYLYIIGKR
jgi:SAM-dependent methyltransferase